MLGFVLSWTCEQRTLCERAFREFAALERFEVFCHANGFDADEVLDLVTEAAVGAERDGRRLVIDIGN